MYFFSIRLKIVAQYALGFVLYQCKTITFFNSLQNNLVQIVEVQIIDDSVSGEPNEDLFLNLLSPITNDVFTTNIIIEDDDREYLRDSWIQH